MTTTMTIPERIEPPKDFRPIRSIYKAKYDSANTDGWPVGHVTVSKYEPGREMGTVVYDYERRYSFLNTFEPFRQYRDGVWHDYALISAAYTTFQVLDLEAGEVIATRPYPQRDWYRTDEYDQYEVLKKDHPEYFEKGGYYEGKGPNDKINGEGFCPVEFWVPDALTEMEFVSADEWENFYNSNEITKGAYREFNFSEQHRSGVISRFAGNGGFVSGCVWGDDSSWKLRWIDLSRITEGVVTEEERFGYWELPSGRLDKLIDYDDDWLVIPAAIHVDLDTGKASAYSKEYINWGDKDHMD